jgi:hypothetical protein
MIVTSLSPPTRVDKKSQVKAESRMHVQSARDFLMTVDSDALTKHVSDSS